MNLATLDKILQAGPNKDNKISLVQLNQLISSYPKVTAELLFYLYNALQYDVIDPTELLVVSINNFNYKGHLVLIALAIRFGAELNNYVNYNGLDNIHIGGYLMLKLTGNNIQKPSAAGQLAKSVHKDLINLAAIMLIVSGSNWNLAMYDASAGSREARGPGLVGRANAKSKSVIHWLQEQGYDLDLILLTVEDPRLSTAVVHKNLDSNIKYLAIVLDRPDLLNNKVLNTDDEATVIIVYANNFYNFLSNKSELITLAILHYNSKVIDILLTKPAFDPDQVDCCRYGQINFVLIKIKLVIDLIIMIETLEQILLTFIDYGNSFDQYQFSMLASLNQNSADNIRKKYNQPRWRKECKNASIPSTEMKQLGISLQISPDSSKSTFCAALDNYHNSDAEALTRAAIGRQQARIASQHGLVGEFGLGSNSKLPDLICRNRAALANDPYEYPDPALSTYRDQTGAIHCFPADMYDLLLQNKINPYTNDKLTNQVLLDIEHKKQQLKQLEIDPMTIATFSKALQLLKQNDQISIDKAKIDNFHQMCAHHGIAAESLQRAKVEDWLAMLRFLNIDSNVTGVQQPFELLTRDHSYMTTIQLIYPILVQRPALRQAFFQQVKRLI